jgi:hypothetical protein
MPVDPATQCVARTLRGEQCKRAWAGAEHRMCNQHNTRLNFTAEDQCTYINPRTNIRCAIRKAPGHPECRAHHNATVKRAETRRRWALYRAHFITIFNLFTAHGVERDRLMPAIWNVIGILMNQNVTVHDAVDAVMVTLPPSPVLTELGRMARDPQSVHTRAVTDQTNRLQELIFLFEVPNNQLTMIEIRRCWDQLFARRPVDERIYNDMQFWYDKNECRVPGDKLYKRILDHLWARIKSIIQIDTRTELIKRLQQECAESFQMCCEGHISRLLNVMSGFDDRFIQTIPKSMILQNRMPKISEIEDEEERYIQATALFAELQMDHEEARPWLDALVEV